MFVERLLSEKGRLTEDACQHCINELHTQVVKTITAKNSPETFTLPLALDPNLSEDGD